VEGTSYFPENSKNDREGFAGLVIVFWIIFGLTLTIEICGYASYINMYGWDHIYKVNLVINAFVIALFAVAAIFLNRRQGWAYFLGVSTFIFTTSLYIYSRFFGEFAITFLAIMNLAIRAGVLVYTLTFLKNALVAMRAPSAEMDDELLDN
jgi:hypothetical protein